MGKKGLLLITVMCCLVACAPKEDAAFYIEQAVDLYLSLRVSEFYRHIVDISEAYAHLSDATASGEEPDYGRALDYGIRACQYYAGRTLKPQDAQFLLRQKEKLRKLYIEVYGERSDFEGWFREQADIWDRKVQEGRKLSGTRIPLSFGRGHDLYRRKNVRRDWR